MHSSRTLISPQKFVPFQNERSSVGTLLTDHSITHQKKFNVKNLKLTKPLKSEEDKVIIQRGNFLMYSKFKKQEYYDSNVVIESQKTEGSKMNRLFDSIPLKNRNSYLYSLYKEGVHYEQDKNTLFQTEQSLTGKPTLVTDCWPDTLQHNKFQNIKPRPDLPKEKKKQHGRLVQPFSTRGPAVGNYDINYTLTKTRTYESHINTEASQEKPRVKFPSFLEPKTSKNMSIKDYKRQYTSLVKKDPVIGEFSNMLRDVETQAKGLQKSDKTERLMKKQLQGVDSMHQKMSLVVGEARELFRHYQSTKYVALNRQWK